VTVRLSIVRIAWVVIAAVASARCGGAEAEKADAANGAAPQAVQVGQENVVVVKRDAIVTGPIVSGELRAEREADVRAELGGSMLQVTVDEGQPVRKGMLLGRIEAVTLEDTRRSAESAVRSSENQLAVATREAERTAQLVEAGALAARDLDVAKNAVASAEAQLADARARLTTVQKQMQDAVIRSPIDGLVLRRAVDSGDVVAPGTELFTIIDPSSMRLDASVPSDELSSLRRGAPVRFSVRGYDQPFLGTIDRISPAADPATRQVPIFVAIPNTGGQLVAGLFAEGRVVSASADGLVVPTNAVNTTEKEAWVLRVRDRQTERVPVTLGLRDDRTERVLITAGVNEGDVLLRGAAQGIAPGTPVQVGAPAPAAR
jgi:membrane fusion protein, multidrug efflux system